MANDRAETSAHGYVWYETQRGLSTCQIVDAQRLILTSLFAYLYPVVGPSGRKYIISSKAAVHTPPLRGTPLKRGRASHERLNSPLERGGSHDGVGGVGVCYEERNTAMHQQFPMRSLCENELTGLPIAVVIVDVQTDEMNPLDI